MQRQKYYISKPVSKSVMLCVLWGFEKKGLKNE